MRGKMVEYNLCRCGNKKQVKSKTCRECFIGGQNTRGRKWWRNKNKKIK